ncbi:MAG: flagellar motor stator protein MotA [Proteobacteria bacterium]|nr:flagellar motor stator protein MotA [Pseudomonadota bacterium]
MFLIIGLVVVFSMVFGGYLLAGGSMGVITKAAPFELMIIFGASVGAFIIANSMGIIKASIGGVGKVAKGPKWKQDDYKDLLSLMFVLMKTLRSKGVVALEAHIENPHESKIFQHFGAIKDDHHLVNFISDFMRMVTMNFDDAYQMEDAMEKDLERHHAEAHEPAHALTIMADGLPALGIVAAVLGIIKTMASISQPVEILGGMIAGALVGTFLGVFLAYAMVGPIASRLGQIIEEESKVFLVVKSIIISHLHGNAPQISVEIGRRSVPGPLQPSFMEMEEHLDELPPDLA